MRCSRLSVRRSAGQLGLGDLLVGAAPVGDLHGLTHDRNPRRLANTLVTPQPPTARKARHKVLAIQKWAILGNAMIRTATPPPVVATAHPYQPTVLARRHLPHTAGISGHWCPHPGAGWTGRMPRLHSCMTSSPASQRCYRAHLLVPASCGSRQRAGPSNLIHCAVSRAKSRPQRIRARSQARKARLAPRRSTPGNASSHLPLGRTKTIEEDGHCA